MRRPLVAANWKMNGSLDSARALASAVAQGAVGLQGCEVALCAPYVHLAEVGRALAGGAVALGAQDVSEHEAGAYTGEVSAGMLAEVGCRYVIVGHSERRRLQGEGDALVAAKFAAARRRGLRPIACVGETLEEREGGLTEQVVRRQLAALLATNPVEHFAEAALAYEPVWAIGTGRTASPEQAQAVHGLLRELLAAHDPAVAAGLRILYGGSLTAANAEALLGQADVDGGLVGGASLDAVQFLQICRAAERLAQEQNA